MIILVENENDFDIIMKKYYKTNINNITNKHYYECRDDDFVKIRIVNNIVVDLCWNIDCRDCGFKTHTFRKEHMNNIISYKQYLRLNKLKRILE